LQRDFLLTANQEDINSSSNWNRVLFDALANAFIKAIDYFNNKGPFLRYR
jgi:hypothetical protein